jgi:hypothetical protein
MMERSYEILAIGRCNADLVLTDATWEAHRNGNNFVRIKKDEKEFEIHVDELPSEENDKVTAQQSLDEVINNIDFSFRWGGGVVNSAKAFHQYQDNSRIKLLTTNRPSLYLKGKDRDLMDHLIDDLRVYPAFLNLIKLPYNVVFGGKNKLVIRNKQIDSCRRLPESDKVMISAMLNDADGVLINALNHSQIMENVVRTVHDENMRYIERFSSKSQNVKELLNSESFLMRPKHRKVVSVITKSFDRDSLIENIYPFTIPIHNREDFITLFYGGSNSDLKSNNYDLELKAMAQLRYGIPTRHGFDRRILDDNNNIYVTLGGSEGYLVAIGDDVYRVGLTDKVDEEFVGVIKQNKSSRSGAGDSFAAGIARQETLRQGRDIRKTAVVANSFVGYFLGFNKTIHESDIVYDKIASLKDNYDSKPLSDKKF